MTVKTEEKAGRPDKPSTSDSESPSRWTTEKGTSSATDRSANGCAEAAVTAWSLGKDEEPEASKVGFSVEIKIKINGHCNKSQSTEQAEDSFQMSCAV